MVCRRSWKRIGRTTGFGQSFIRQFGQQRSVCSWLSSTWPQPCRRQTWRQEQTMPARPRARRKMASRATSRRSSRRISSRCSSQRAHPSPLGRFQEPGAARPPWRTPRRSVRCGRVLSASPLPRLQRCSAGPWAVPSGAVGRSASSGRPAATAGALLGNFLHRDLSKAHPRPPWEDPLAEGHAAGSQGFEHRRLLFPAFASPSASVARRGPSSVQAHRRSGMG